MAEPIIIRTMQADDAPRIAVTFAGWNKTLAQYLRYYTENLQGHRVTVVAIIHAAANRVDNPTVTMIANYLDDPPSAASNVSVETLHAGSVQVDSLQETTAQQEAMVEVVGYGNVIWQPDYLPFLNAGIPEINDLNVIERYQKRGIGRALIAACEQKVAAAGYPRIGIGYGLTPDYAAAQHLYPRLGYVLDGRGRHATPWGDVEYLVK